MVRTQIYLTKAQHNALKKLAAERKTTLSQVLREAANKATKTRRKKPQAVTLADAAESIFGIWKDRSGEEIAFLLDRKRDLQSNRERQVLEFMSEPN